MRVSPSTLGRTRVSMRAVGIGWRFGDPPGAFSFRRSLHATSTSSSASQVAASQASLGKRPPMFYVPELAKTRPETSVTLPEEESKHATMVLRLKEGAAVQVCDGRGCVGRGVVEVVGNKKQLTRVKVADVRMEPRPLGTRWHVAVACGSLKGSRGDWLVEKCAEIGATRLTPVLTSRSSHMNPKDGDRYARLTVSVMKQSLQAWKMDVGEVCGIFEFLDGLDHGSRVFVGAESAAGFGETLMGIREGGAGQREQVEQAVILVGPEGDFTPDELEGLVERGVTPVGLGPRRLRTETAAIVMLSAGVVALDT